MNNVCVSMEDLIMQKQSVTEILGTLLPNVTYISKMPKPDEEGMIIKMYMTNRIIDSRFYIAMAEELLIASEKDDIEIFLQTPGGNAFSGIVVISAMLRTKANYKVIANGMCASCGGIILFEAPLERIEIRDWAEVMIHGPSYLLKGKSLDIKDNVDALLKWTESRYKLYVKKGLLTEEEYDQVMNKKIDVFISPEKLRQRLKSQKGE